MSVIWLRTDKVEWGKKDKFYFILGLDFGAVPEGAQILALCSGMISDSV